MGWVEPGGAGAPARTPPWPPRAAHRRSQPSCLDGLGVLLHHQGLGVRPIRLLGGGVILFVLVQHDGGRRNAGVVVVVGGGGIAVLAAEPQTGVGRRFRSVQVVVVVGLGGEEGVEARAGCWRVAGRAGRG